MRLRLAMAVLALGCCAIAACTNSTGGSSTMPGGQLPQAIAPTTSTPAPTPTPNVMSGNIQILGDGATQTLPAPGDFKVTATFPKSAASSARFIDHSERQRFRSGSGRHSGVRCRRQTEERFVRQGGASRAISRDSVRDIRIRQRRDVREFAGHRCRDSAFRAGSVRHRSFYRHRDLRSG